MEHEVFVPVPVGRLREALSDPERVARAVPGLQQDAGTPPVAGRLRVRVAGHTITYRGALRVTPQDDGSYAVEGDATESRGTGSVQLTLTLGLVPALGGTTLTYVGTATADGRVTELPPEGVSSAVTRLLGRFAENLGAVADEEREKEEGTRQGQQEEEGTPAPETKAPEAAGGPAEDEGEGEDEGEDAPTVDAESAESAEAPESADTTDAEAAGTADTEAAGPTGDTGASGEDEPPASAFESDVPPSPLDPFAEGDFVAGNEPPAEAAHARRTMIGRSAEEVDHAPPRGRYAPVPAPETVSASAALRWAAPAAALAVATAVIVSRALRRRR
ncbi:SRPBCC family protein [Streptomyces sp. TG1A-60]|uniref:SRPBCC family protein n=1 Tax=Streptomyces sp. TG1A-60 TaxID=3129111 RepID=UPI0030D5B9E4